MTVADGGTLAGTAGQTLTLGSLDLKKNAIIDVILGAPGTNGLFDVKGDITLDGHLDIRDGGGFGAGVYRLFDYSGALTDNGLDIGATPNGTDASDLFVQTAQPGQINLIDSAGQTLSFWDGGNAAQHDNSAVDGGNGTWQLNDRNWTGPDGKINGGYSNPTLALFEGDAGTVTVDNGAGDISVTGIQFATNGYTVTGDPIGLAGANGTTAIRVGDGTQAGANTTATIASILTGSSTLDKTDLGTLILTGKNSYTGDTIISDGTLQLGNGGTTGSITGDVTDNAALGFNRSDDVTFGGVISGTGRVNHTGTGTTTLTGKNSYSGGTTVSAGTLAGNTTSLQGNITDNAALLFNQTNDGSYAGTIDGSGALSKTGSGVLSLTGANRYTGGTTITAGILQLGNGGTTGSITGDVTDNAGLAFDRNDDITFDGSISGTGTVSQNGSGTTKLTATNSYSGGTTITDGALSVAADANLGATKGDLTLAGGALATTTSFDSGRAVILSSDGIFDTADSSTLGLSGVISGAGNLIKQGNGTLSLTGHNSYGGNTVVDNGTLIGNAASLRGDLANAGTVVFDQADDAVFAGNITGLNTRNGTLVKRGAGELTLTGHSALDTTIDAGRLVSSTDRFGGDLDIGSGARMTFDQSSAGAYAGTLSGDGDVMFTGGGAVALTADNSGFAGTSTVTSSTLTVNHTLAGNLRIDQGGRLKGSGTVGDTTIAKDGTIAPGNSPGTLQVNGDITFDKGSRYEVEVQPGGTAHDLIAASGKATLNGGSVAHVGLTGTYDPTATYTLLTAKKGVQGQFDSVSSNFAFLDPILGYDADNVTLTLKRNDIAFVDAARTRSQRAVAAGADSLSFGNVVYDSLVQLDDPAARRAFDLLSGEIHASTKTALIQDSRYLRQTMIERMRIAQGNTDDKATRGPSRRIRTAAGDTGSATWARAIGAWGGSDSDGNAAELDRSTRGFLLGGDAQIAKHWRAGVTAGFTRSQFDVDPRQSSGDSEDYHLGVYTGTRRGPIRLTLGAGYSWHDIDSQRSVVYPGFAHALQSSHHAATAQVFGEFGYAIDAGPVQLEPFANAAYINLHSDGFTEAGDTAALHVRAGHTDTTFSTLGLRASNRLELNDATLTLHGSAGWRHAYGDTTPTVTEALAGGSDFTVAGVPIADDSAVINVGVGMNIAEQTTLGVSYGGLFGSDVHDNSGQLDLTVRF